MSYRIGCDVGGTNTDSALLDVTRLSEPAKAVLATCKIPTSPNVAEGIQQAIEDVLRTSAVDRSKIQNVSIGTTAFVNAVLERDSRRLSKTAVIRLCGPYTRSTPPFSDFPYALRNVIEGPAFYLDGGLEIDGREITKLDPEQIRRAATEISQQGITSVALVGVFSALDSQGLHEEKCKAIIQESNPELSVVCSHKIGGPFLERENATIVNAAMLKFARRTIAGFRLAMEELKLDCPLFLTTNDGTLADAASAAELPVKTFASGPTNSLIGAAFLQGYGQGAQDASGEQVIICDIGGTTSDVCALLPSGFPRQAPNFVEVGGVRTAFSMPEVLSIAVGGGSRVRQNGEVTTIGPDSVALRLQQDALAFGGNVLTTTDIMVASGEAKIGDASKVTHITPQQISGAKKEIKRLIEQAIDTMKVSSDAVVCLLVGGGSILVTDELKGVEQCLRPPHHAAANAVGAAIAKVSGDVDLIEVLEGKDVNQVVESVKRRAIEDAIAKGADPADIQIVKVEKIPLQYVTNKATRFVIKAVGNLKVAEAASARPVASNGVHSDDVPEAAEASKGEVLKEQQGSMAHPTLGVDLSSYRPDVRDGVWYISPVDVELIASGVGVLGTGGGGSSYLMALQTQHVLRKGGVVRVISSEKLNDHDMCVQGAGYGAPSVSDERLSAGTEVVGAVDAVNKIMGIKDFAGIVAAEIGGGNGLVTFPSSAHYDRPVVDCDLMGRGKHFLPPFLAHITKPLTNSPPSIPNPPTLHRLPLRRARLPLRHRRRPRQHRRRLASRELRKGLTFSDILYILTHPLTLFLQVESLIRTACIELGNASGTASAPFSGAIIKKYAIPNTVSQAWYLGRAIHLARQTKIDFIDAIGDVTPVRLLYEGKIGDVRRDVSRGYTVGRCLLGPLSADEQKEGGDGGKRETRHAVIPFQNEYLALRYVEEGEGREDGGEEKGEMVCTVPDLISVLGVDGEALGSPELRYGLRVKVIGMPASPTWTKTEEGLKVGGPEFFGLGCEFKSVGEYRRPRSVIEEFGG